MPIDLTNGQLCYKCVFYQLTNAVRHGSVVGVDATSKWAFYSALGNTLDDRIAQMVFVQALV